MQGCAESDTKPHIAHVVANETICNRDVNKISNKEVSISLQLQLKRHIHI